MSQLHNFISILNLSLKSGNFFFRFQKTKFVLQILHILIKNHYIIGYKICPDHKTSLLIFLKLTVNSKRPVMVACKILTSSNNPTYLKYNTNHFPLDSSLVIISTSQGLLTQKEAFYRKLGGRFLFKVI